jgi:2-phosphoglycerate kinase
MTTNSPARSWEVLLIGGASGVGKTSISYRIAQHFGIGITEIDDLVIAVKHMTTPEQQPILHYWDTQRETRSWSAERLTELTIANGSTMLPALEAVIANHLEAHIPVVMEGDFFHPALAAQAQFLDEPNEGRVRALFVHEPDEAQIIANYLAREPHQPEQIRRARTSLLYGNWLAAEAERVGVPVLPARPWDTVFERALAAIG